MEWVELMEKRRLHSLRDMAEALSVSPQTVARLVHGDSSSRETIEAAAALFNVPPERIRQLRREPARPAFRLPAEADSLGRKQRAAVIAVIRAMLDSDREPDVPITTPGDPRDQREAERNVQRIPRKPTAERDPAGRAESPSEDLR